MTSFKGQASGVTKKRLHLTPLTMLIAALMIGAIGAVLAEIYPALSCLYLCGPGDATISTVTTTAPQVVTPEASVTVAGLLIIVFVIVSIVVMELVELARGRAVAPRRGRSPRTTRG